MIRLLISLTLVICIFWLSSCCAIMNSSGKIATVNSNPSGARIFSDGNDTGKITPANIELEKVHKDNFIRIEKEGYESSEYILSRTTSPWLLGNLVFGYGAVIGLLIDVGSGSIYKLDPNEVTVELKAK